MKFKIKANQINGFCEFLLTLEIKGKDSRMRTRMIRKLDEKLKDINSEYTEHILKEYCHLDDKGNPKTKEVNGRGFWDIKEGKQEDFNKDYIELWNESHIIEGEDHSNMLLSVKEAVLNCDKTFSGQEALQYDLWCELVEGIEENN